MLLKDHASAKLNFLLDFSLRARNSSVNRVKINEIITIVSFRWSKSFAANNVSSS